jgi:RHS repeat-associated protein
MRPAPSPGSTPTIWAAPPPPPAPTARWPLPGPSAPSFDPPGRRIADATGCEGREHYTPFGEIINDPGHNRDEAGFTGHIRDDATGLIYAQARYYNPVIGRFYAPDPVGFASGGPGYFNRHAYTMNDPVNFIDPTGACREVEDANGGKVSIGLCLSDTLNDTQRAELEAAITAASEFLGFDIVEAVDNAAEAAFRDSGRVSGADFVVGLATGEADQFVQHRRTDAAIGGTIYLSGRTLEFLGVDTRTGQSAWGAMGPGEILAHEGIHAAESLGGGFDSRTQLYISASSSGLGHRMNLVEANAITRMNEFRARNGSHWRRTHWTGGRVIHD